MAQPRLLTTYRQTTTLFGPGLHRSIAPSPLHRRTFLGQATSPLTLHATRTLPYYAKDLYRLVSDISEYPNFIPYCKSAKVETWSHPDSETNSKWPATATMRIGYGNFSEAFLSKVYCVPNQMVEAISGDAETALLASDLVHYKGLENNDATTRNGLFTSLRTRWSLKPYEYKPAEKHPDIVNDKAHWSEISVEKDGYPNQGQGSIKSEPRTDVSLIIEVNWKNPMYAAASQALAPSVAGKIVEAFEKRATEVLGSK